jgi:Kef-type K+ transport system membrane component KefB
MHPEHIISTIFLIFTGAAVLATVALYARQTLLVAYIAIGLILGQSGFNLIADAGFLQQISDIGIMFLLFLLGLNLNPNKLIHLLKSSTILVVASSLLFAGFGYLIAISFGFSSTESLVIAASSIFSSTIIGLKLLPTTVLHHRHTGEIIISILLLQDLIAIGLLMFLHTQGQVNANDPSAQQHLLTLLISFPTIILVAYLSEKYILQRLFLRFDTILEYVFLLAIAWCLGMAELATLMGLSHEIGAFIAGVAIASGPISKFIAESLKPLRDFFLIIFFFTIGASFDISQLGDILIPGIILAVFALTLKPIIFKKLLQLSGEDTAVATEVGFRVGQLSEFSILLGALALQVGVISQSASQLIQLATLLTFIVSSYLIVFRYPTPIATSDHLRRD